MTSRGKPARRPVLPRGRLATVLTAAVAAAVPALAAQPAAGEDWPMFGHDPRHGGVSAETTISRSNAASLGVAWQANTGDAVSASPVVAFDASRGRQVVYVGNSAGVMSAYDAATGRRLWVQPTGGSINSTAAVAGGVVYVGSADRRLYALDAATGQVRCSFAAGGVIASSPVVADPDGAGGAGRVVYVGDNGVGGVDDGGHLWAVNAVDPDPAVNCSRRWVFDGYGEPPGSQPAAGTWSPPAFARDSAGRPLVVFGGSSPDDAVYALDGRTGARVWRFQANPEGKPDADVGAGATISAPGVNGFADGVVYISGKENATYALNLRTGRLIWRFDIAADSPGVEGYARSTAALTRNLLFLGYGAGIYQLDAVTRERLWSTADVGPVTAEVISSPGLVGPDGQRVVVAGDLAGRVMAFSAATGARLWTHRTGGQVYSSPAIAGGRIFIGSTDGFLYAFTPGGATGQPPATTVGFPADGAVVANPAGALRISGRAEDNTAVSGVQWALRNNNTRRWWNAAARAWQVVYVQNPAALTAPGAATTGWSASFPVPSNGGAFTAYAEAVDPGGLHDPTPAISSFFVDSLGQPPDTTISAPSNGQVFTFPGGVRRSFPVTISGTATDPGGTSRGIQQVRVVVQNLDHGEYFCGSPDCNQFGDFPWVANFRSPPATLASPGAATTTWRIDVPVYDHPHSYSVTAWAVDADGLVEQSRPTRVFCVRDAGATGC